MPINFAAVHDRKPWRKHSNHQSLHAAVDGDDGAKNLLRRLRRVAKMWDKYGDVRCVFVWEDDAELGQVFRIDPEKSGTIQSRTIGIDKILQFQKNKGCSAQEIVDCFRDESLPEMGQEAGQIRQTVLPPSIAIGIYPDEISEKIDYIEGVAQQVCVNRFERSLDARNACIDHYGCICQACFVDFGQRYGQLGIGFIHVHHRVPIASIGTEYCVDPVKDLVPVCPNCHAMLHRREPPLEIEELRALIHNS